MRKYTVVIAVLIGAAAYVIGAKAGRPRYKQLWDTATSFWNDPAVKKARARAVRAARKNAEKTANQGSGKVKNR